MNQTLLEYQMLGLTDDDDPELARILKFINKFGGDSWLADRPDGWVSARDVARWWSPKATRKSDNILKFMSKLVELGHATANDESLQSSKFKIKILHGKSADNADKTSETDIHQRLQSFIQKPTKLPTETIKPNHINVSAPQPTKAASEPTPADKNGHNSNGGDGYVKTVGTVGITVKNVGYRADTLNNGGLGDSTPDFVGSKTSDINSIQSNDSSDNVGIVGTFSQVNIKIGDRVELGGEIATVEKIEGDFVGYRTEDGSYIGGYVDSVKLLETLTSYKKIAEGDGFIEIVTNNSADTTDAGEEGIEYEC
jgi:hypothetical protein